MSTGSIEPAVVVYELHLYIVDLVKSGSGWLASDPAHERPLQLIAGDAHTLVLASGHEVPIVVESVGTDGTEFTTSGAIAGF